MLLLAVAAVAAYALGILRPERVLATDAPTLFFAGAFAVVVGTLVFRFWRLNEPSAHYFRLTGRVRPREGESHFMGGRRLKVTLGTNQGEAFDLRPSTQRALCVLFALLLVLTSLDARSLGLLSRFQRGIAAANSSFCPDTAETTHDVSAANAPGCALIRRAYALGYAKDLGDCGEKKKQATAICTLRQRDEPFLHYAWRLLDGAYDKFRHGTSPEYLAGLKHDFDERLAKLSQLNAARSQILSSAPHASHHIWTPLPEPREEDLRARTESCADRFRSLPHRPPLVEGPSRQSRVFEHTLAQLLFESSYEPAAGSCREYHIHWGAPPDACEKLAATPEAFLTQWGALSDVQATLDRQKLVSELDTLDARGTKSQRQLDPTAFVSFQCYSEQLPAGRAARTFKLAGIRFDAQDVRVPPEPPDATLYVDRYPWIASMLVGGFHYGGLMSEAGVEQASGEGSLEPAFNGKDFLFARLYGLANVDIYLEPGWIAHRPDLLEVYPYELHLRNFVKVFRRQYARERGRL